MQEDSSLGSFAPLREPTISKFHFYNYGFVAQNKKLKEKVIEVYPTEDAPFTDGEVYVQRIEEEAKGKDATKAEYATKVTSGTTIPATWLRLGNDNRLTAPDVRRGEAVVLYQFGDSMTLFWTTVRDDHRLRKLETAVYGWSATRDESAGVSPETLYYLEVSTHRKVVTFHTSKADGEPFSYDVQINAKEGKVLIQDDAGNSIELDSAESRIQLINNHGSHWDMHKTNLTYTIPETVLGKCRDFTVQAENNITLNAGSTFSAVGTGEATMASSGGATVKGASANLLGSRSARVASPATSVT